MQDMVLGRYTWHSSNPEVFQDVLELVEFPAVIMGERDIQKVILCVQVT
jgi:hypothetical protein